MPLFLCRVALRRLVFVLSATAEESATGEVGAGETTVGAVEAVREEEVAGQKEQKGTDIHAAEAERGTYIRMCVSEMISVCPPSPSMYPSLYLSIYLPPSLP